MTTSGISEPNPYVGPRSIQQGEPLYGRLEEVYALYCELQARRIVVLHSPSGAGKSSLVQAGLIPRLQEEKYDVWKPIRVNLDPTGLEGVPEGTNRYLLSAMLSLEEELPEGKRRVPAQLAGMELATYLRTRPRRKKQQGRPVVLLFDQFEEVLTMAPRAVEAKRAFFTAVGQALADELYWALFIIREDFLAAFAPYRDRIPTHMANTLRLDLLGLAGAREAALRPALAGRREFPAVDQLIRDLSTTQVQQADGSFVAEQGPHVEPVQLQVVCRRLWAAMPADDRSIDAVDIDQYASVSDSLAGYYAQTAADVSGGDVAFERAIREWVGDGLIAGGVRSQIRQAPGKSGGLDNALIQGLLDSYLVRIEHRAGANWFELSHDRLVVPVQQDNERWAKSYLHPMQVQAKLWDDAKRPTALLLGASLPEAERWAEDHAARLTEGEREYLAQSRAIRAERQRRRRAERLFTTGITVVALVAISLGVVAWYKGIEADQQARRADEKAAAATAAEQEAVKTLNDQRGLRASMLAKEAGHELEAIGLAVEAFGELDAQASRVSAPVFTGLTSALMGVQTGVPLVGHSNLVVAVAYSSDGTRIATASVDQTVRLWDARSGAPLRTFEGHTGPVHALAFSPDGARIATASEDKTARLWDVEAGKELISLEQEGPARDVAFSPDGTRIATASGKTVRVWDMGSDAFVVPFIGHTGPVYAVAFSPDGTLLATASEDQTARVWDADSGAPLRILEGHTGPVYAVAFSLDGMRIATASRDETARSWDASTGEQAISFAHDDVVYAVEFSPDGKQLATGTFDDDAAHLWSASSGLELADFRHEGPVVDVAFSPDGTQLATASWDKTARLWNLDPGGALTTLEGHSRRVDAVAFSPDGTRIATASGDATARLWDAHSGRSIAVLRGHRLDLAAVAFSPDGTRIATASRDGTARLWDADSGAWERTLEGHTGPVHAVAFSPDGARILTASADHTARIWDSSIGKELRSLAHEGPVLDATFAPNGERLLTVGADEMAHVWDASTGAALGSFVQDAPVTAVAFSADGKHIATATKDYSVRSWDADSGKLDATFSGHSAAILALVFSADGARIATASEDRTARVWDTSTGAELVAFPHERPVLDVLFSPDGTRIVTASAERVAWVWALEPRHWFAWGCAVLDVRQALTDATRRACHSAAGATSNAAERGGRVEVIPPPSDGAGPEPDTINVHGVELVLIPGGTFMMGSPEGMGEANERPQQEITLDSFYLARTEVTNAQYALYLEANPTAEKPGGWENVRYNQPEQPVVKVSWYDAKAYCDWAGLVLPTEAQWEYAARAGTTTTYWFGDDEEELERFGWYAANSGGRAHSVGTKGANAFGLHDVHGNVHEWTLDAQGEYTTSVHVGDGLRVEPVGGAYQIGRSGNYGNPATVARSAFRGAGPPDFSDYDLGFRPARPL